MQRAGAERTTGDTVTVLALCLVPLVVLLAPAAEDRIIYPYALLCGLLPAWACFRRGRGSIARWQWTALALFFGFSALDYLPASLFAFGGLSARASSWLGVVASALATTAGLIAAVERPRPGRGWVATLDVALIALLGVLHMAGQMSLGATGLRPYHAVVFLLSVVFMAVVAVAAYLGAETAENTKAMRVLMIFLLIKTCTVFLVNFVNIQLVRSDRYDALFDCFIVVSPLVAWSLCRRRGGESQGRRGEPLPAVQTLFAGTLALGVLLTAQIAWWGNPQVLAVVTVVAFLVFAARTHALYRATLQEKGSLQVRAGTLETLATRDPLTGIGNRRLLEGAAEALLAEPGRETALLAIDVDHFKEINDALGHRTGDAVLRAVATLLADAVGGFRNSCCGRVGGDELVGVLAGVDDDACLQMAEGLRLAVEQLDVALPLRVTVSIGLATTRERLGYEDLLERADAALYRAKALGRNTVVADSCSSAQATMGNLVAAI